MIQQNPDMVALENENRMLRAGAAKGKLEVLRALAETIAATKEMFEGPIQIDVDRDSEHPSDLKVVLIVEARDDGTSSAVQRMTWRERLSELDGGLFDRIRLLFEYGR